MEGINFVTDSNDNKIAVQIDLKKHAELWQDFYDILIAEQRKDEPGIPFEQVIKELKAEGKLPEDA